MGGNHPFPDENIDPKKKGKDYWLKVVYATWHLYLNNRCIVPYNFPSTGFDDSEYSIDEQRAYATGKINVNKYKPLLAQLSKSTHPVLAGKTMMNISWRQVPIIPKFVDIAKGMFMQMDYDFDVNSVDARDVEEKELQKAFYKVEHNIEYRKFVAGMEALGVQVNKEAKDKFESEAQVDLAAMMGMFKVAHEAELYTALKATMDASSWDIIKDKLFEDLISVSKTATCTYVEPSTQTVKTRWADIRNVISRKSPYEDGRTIDWIGEIRYNVTISELREQFKVEETTLRKIVKDYSQMRNWNATNIYNTVYQGQSYAQNGFYSYDGFGVDLLELYYISGDTEKYTEVYNKKKARTSFNKVGNDYQESEEGKKDGKKLSTVREERLYKIVWVVGTDILVECGLAHDVPYQDGKPMLPIQVYDTKTVSLVSRMIGFQDDINLATYKFRNALAKVPPPPRMQVEQRSISNVTLGGTKMKETDVINLFGESGLFLMNSLNDHRQPNSATPGRPVTYLQSGIAEDFGMFIQTIDHNINMMRLVIGMNETADGSTQGERKAVRVAQMEMNSTNNALFPIQRGYISIFERTMDVAMCKWQIVASGGKEIKYKGLNQSTYDIIKLGATHSARNFGLKVKILPTKEELKQFLVNIENMYAGRQQTGQGGISYEKYIILTRIIQTGNLDLAQLMAVQLVNKQRQEDAETKAQDVQLNADQQIQSAQAANEMKMGEIQMEIDLQLKADMQMKDLDFQMKELESQLRMQEMILQSKLAKGEIETVEQFETMRTTMKLAIQEQKDALMAATQIKIAEISAAAKKQTANKSSKKVA